MISITDAQLRLGGNIIFTKLSWRIDSTKRVGLVGDNGSGKSSLLRVLTGEYTLEAGAIETSKNLRLGYLPQDSAELPHMTVGEALWQAFAPLNQMERDIKALLDEIEHSGDETPAHARAVKRYGELQEEFQHRGGYQRESDAKKILLGLGFQHSDWDRQVAEFSGGWRMRVLLGKLLLEKHDIMLLDEPTNHLDPATLDWLEQHLQSMECGLAIVSHDRFFLDRMTNEIAEIERGRFYQYTGNYSKYRELKTLMREQLIAQKKQQDKEIAHMEAFITRFRAKNTKATQAQSRIKQLEKIERIEVQEDTPIVSIPMPRTPRGSKDAIRLEGVGHCYGDFRALHPVDAVVFREDRICLWGPNGAGKSTLVGLLAKTLTPTDGKVEWGVNSRIAYFSQQQAELQQSTRSVLDELAAAAPAEMQASLRDVLAPFLFRGEDVFKPVSVLSGGEKSRLALAKLLVHPCNVLLLDEPLNHLDIRTVETLEATLKEFPGAIVFVSHDRFFADRLAQQIWEMEAGRLVVYRGDFSDYQYAKRLQQEKEPQARTANAASADEQGQRQQRKEQKRREAQERNKLSAVRREQRQQYQAVEQEIHEVEDEMQLLEEKMSSGELVRKADEMRAAKQRYDHLLERKDILYAQWEDLIELMEK